MRQINFIENPSNRTQADKPIGAITAGQRWDSVYIEVSLATYTTQEFRDWIDQCIIPRILPGGSMRIAVISGMASQPMDN